MSESRDQSHLNKKAKKNVQDLFYKRLFFTFLYCWNDSSNRVRSFSRPDLMHSLVAPVVLVPRDDLVAAGLLLHLRWEAHVDDPAALLHPPQLVVLAVAVLKGQGRAALFVQRKKLFINNFLFLTFSPHVLAESAVGDRDDLVRHGLVPERAAVPEEDLRGSEEINIRVEFIKKNDDREKLTCSGSPVYSATLSLHLLLRSLYTCKFGGKLMLLVTDFNSCWPLAHLQLL